MDCKVEAAVLAGLGRTTPVMLTPAHGGWHHQHYPQSPLPPPPSAQEGEPYYCSATEQGGLLWEDFSVDDLLDLGDVGKEQHGDEGEEFLRVGDVEGEGEEGEESTGGLRNSNTSSSFTTTTTTTTTSALSFQTVAIPPSSSDPIIVPAGDVEDLEWVSRFVDDSYSEFAAAAHASPFANLHAPPPEAAVKAGAPKASSTSSGTPLKRSWHSCSFSTASVAVPAKARSKRPRTGGRLWFFGRTSFLSEPSSSSCSSVSSSSCCSVFSSVTSFLGDGGGNAGRLLHSLGGTPPLGLRLPQALKKKKGRKPKVVPATAPGEGGGNGGDAEQEARRHCSHCGVEKTPQWRAGPMGAKTLCNACGVRYKSGRLLPEYRPAGSPTFLSQVHSNSHSKVLEIRRSNELIAAAGPAASCSPSPPQQPAGPTRPYGVV